MTNMVAVTGIVIKAAERNSEGKFPKDSLVTILTSVTNEESSSKTSSEESEEEEEYPIYKSEYLKIFICFNNFHARKNVCYAMRVGILVNVIGSLCEITLPNGSKVIGIQAKEVEFLTHRKIDTEFDPMKFMCLYNNKQLNAKYRRVRKEMKKMKEQRKEEADET